MGDEAEALGRHGRSELGAGAVGQTGWNSGGGEAHTPAHGQSRAILAFSGGESGGLRVVDRH